MACHNTGDGATNPPFGLFGGTPGIGGGNYRESLETGHRDFCSAKGYMEISPGETWVGVSSGGGGFGDPLERDAEKVCQHVRDGIISEEVARDVYGLVFDGKLYLVDQEATSVRREKIRGERGALPDLQPTKPGAGTWAKENMRKGDEFLLDPLP